MYVSWHFPCKRKNGWDPMLIFPYLQNSGRKFCSCAFTIIVTLTLFLVLMGSKVGNYHETGTCSCTIHHCMKPGHVMKHFCLSCVHTIYFLRKSSEFHDMWIECQRIIIHSFYLFSFINCLWLLSAVFFWDVPGLCEKFCNRSWYWFFLLYCIFLRFCTGKLFRFFHYFTFHNIF